MFLYDVACQKLLNSANVSRSNSQNNTGTVFFETRCIIIHCLTLERRVPQLLHLNDRQTGRQIHNSKNRNVGLQNNYFMHIHAVTNASKIGNTNTIQCESKKVSPWGFLTFFPNGRDFFKQFFTHLLYVPIYARLHIFIQLSILFWLTLYIGAISI